MHTALPLARLSASSIQKFNHFLHHTETSIWTQKTKHILSRLSRVCVFGAGWQCDRLNNERKMEKFAIFFCLLLLHYSLRIHGAEGERSVENATSCFFFQWKLKKRDDFISTYFAAEKKFVVCYTNTKCKRYLHPFLFAIENEICKARNSHVIR